MGAPVKVLEHLGRLWGRVEDGFWWAWWRIRRRRRLLEAKAQELGRELWDLVDDLPLIGAIAPIAPVRNQFYGHGAFMGAAPSLLADPSWRRILAFLMPDVYLDVEAALKGGARPQRIIPMFENNPVMAAFGTWRSAALRRASGVRPGPHDLSGHEWDVFVDSGLVDRWEKADGWDAAGVAARLVDTMLVAHATSTDTVQEQIGLSQYGDVRKTRKTQLGGVEAPAWMDLYGRALALAESADLAGAIRAMAADARDPSPEECRRHTFATPWPMREVAERSARVTGRPHLSVVLEIKSLRSTPSLLVAIVSELNRRGVHVAAVGSFVRAEIAGVSAARQDVGTGVLPGPAEILFFHTVGDVQAACDRGELPAGQHALFNGASLFEEDTWRVDARVLAGLDALRREHDLRLGFYVQEGDCDAAAASALSAACDAHPETFELGFAWGGLQDEAALPAGEGDHRGYGGQALLVQLGAARRWRFDTDPVAT